MSQRNLPAGDTTRRPLLIGPALLAATLAIPGAWGQALSSDVELIHPRPSPGALPGLESSNRDETGTLRAQTTLQFEDSPLVLYSDDGEVGAVVHRRITGHLGVAGTIAKRWRVGGSIPMHGQWGSEVPDLAADGFGVGDLRIHGSYWIGRSTVGEFTAHLGFALPFGRRNAWMGDQGPRTELGIAYATGVRRTEIHANVGIDARAAWHLDAGLYDRGSAVLASGGVRGPIVSDTLDLFGALYTRWGGGIFLGRPDLVVSAMAGARYKPTKTLDVDLGVGRGFTPGVGTTDIRVLAQVSWHRTPPAEEPEEEEFIVVKVEPEVPEPEPEKPPPEPEEPPPAQVVGEKVIVTAPILFFVDTAKLKPESKPAMEAIAELMADDPRIGHLVIEGHASAEGTFEYNYDLSARRARAIHEALMQEGVHKSRISYRGMGEVEPIVPGESEEALAKNRRVEFHIIKRRTPGDGNFEHPEQAPLPWSGEQVDTPVPEWPEDVLEKYEEEQAKIQKALGPVIEDDAEDAFTFDDPEMQGPVRVQTPPPIDEPEPEPVQPSPQPPTGIKVTPNPEPIPAPQPEATPAPQPETAPAPQPEAAPAPQPEATPAPQPEPPEPAANASGDGTTDASTPATDSRYLFKVYGTFIPLFTAQTDTLRSEGKLPAKHYKLAVDAVIDASGRLRSVKVVESSGIEALDGAAVRAFYQAQPFEPPPADALTDGQLTLEAIRFDVEGSGDAEDDGADVPSGDRLQELLDEGGEQ